MRMIQTDRFNPKDLKPEERSLVYNGLDCCVTLEVYPCLEQQLDNQTRSTYEFSKSLQGPVLDMRFRGVRVDIDERDKVIEEYNDKLDTLEINLERIVREGVGMVGFNWRSNPDLHTLFYDCLGIPVQHKKGRPTVDRNALEKIEVYNIARPIVRHLKNMRELGKRIGFLKTEIDDDGRIRTSYNIAGTETGRFASSYSEFGTGTNMQNVEDRNRQIFIADPGMKMAEIDAMQGESRAVGAIEWNLFHDGTYLDACESGDLHTTVAKLVWPELPWTGDLEHDKALAEQKYYRHYTRRFMCKKLGHGSNYGGQDRTLSEQAKVEIEPVRTFQRNYFGAFPSKLEWHKWVRREILETGRLTTLTGRRRDFWGRRNADDTIREAIAYDPQGSLADIVNTGLVQVWRADLAQLLLQNHDSIVVQYPEEQEDEIIPQLLEIVEAPVELQHGRTLTIPYDCKTGWNWGKYSKDNPDGLKEYKPGDQRKRQKEVRIVH